MGIFYDPAARKWEVVNEKTDHSTTKPTGTTLYKITTINYLSNYRFGGSKTVTYSTTPGTSQSIDYRGAKVGEIVADSNPINIDANTDLNTVDSKIA